MHFLTGKEMQHPTVKIVRFPCISPPPQIPSDGDRERCHVDPAFDVSVCCAPVRARAACAHCRTPSAQSKLPSGSVGSGKRNPPPPTPEKRLHLRIERTTPLERTEAASEKEESEAMRASARAIAANVCSAGGVTGSAGKERAWDDDRGARRVDERSQGLQGGGRREAMGLTRRCAVQRAEQLWLGIAGARAAVSDLQRVQVEV